MMEPVVRNTKKILVVIIGILMSSCAMTNNTNRYKSDVIIAGLDNDNGYISMNIEVAPNIVVVSDNKDNIVAIIHDTTSGYWVGDKSKKYQICYYDVDNSAYDNVQREYRPLVELSPDCIFRTFFLENNGYWYVKNDTLRNIVTMPQKVDLSASEAIQRTSLRDFLSMFNEGNVSNNVFEYMMRVNAQ